MSRRLPQFCMCIHLDFVAQKQNIHRNFKQVQQKNWNIFVATMPGQKPVKRLNLIVCISILVSWNIQLSGSRETRHLYARLISDLRDLELFEFKVAQNLTQALLGSSILPIGSEIRRLVHSYLVDFYQTTGYTQIRDVIGKEETGASKNPICAYRLIRRVKFLLQHLISHKLFSIKFGQLLKEITFFFWENGWPLYEDLKIASESLLRIQHVYDLNAEKFANGWIFDVHTNCTLNSINCYELANFAISSDQFSAAIEWLEAAKERSLADKKSSLPLTLFALSNAIDEHNFDFDSEIKEDNGPAFFNRKIRHIPGDGRKAQKIRTTTFNKFKGRRSKSYEKVNYWGLCSGENFQTEKERSYLFCYYEFKLHPSLTIGPMKMEFLARNPDVVQIYEVLQETESKQIHSESSSRIFASKLQTLGHRRNGQSSFVSSKTSLNVLQNITGKNNWLRKIHQISGLNSVSSEIQVESYSLAGHYFPRLDKAPTKSKDFAHHRAATLMLHINEVEKGGETAFTSLGVAAKPVKGSAVFWYNLHQDGSVDRSTNHGTCPVLIGEKIVARKWILLEDFLFGRMCGLDPNDKHRISINGVYLPAPDGIRPSDHVEVTPPSKYPNDDPQQLSKYCFVASKCMKALVQFEWSMYPQIKYLYHKYRNLTTGTFRDEFDRHNKDVQMYLEEFENFTVSVLGSLDSLSVGNSELVEKIAWNPLAGYRLVNRVMTYVQTWARQRPTSENKLKMRIRSYLSKIYNVSDGPTESDFEAAMFAILNIQFIHGLAVKDIAHGILTGIHAKVGLNARDCYYIGKYGASYNYFPSSIQFLEHSLNLLMNTSDSSVSYEEVYDQLATVQIKQECYKGKWTPICSRDDSEQPSSPEVNDVGHVKFWELCKGKVFQEEKEKSKLFCWYERETHPSYKIGPIKAEWISRYPKPDVVHYYDIISGRTMDTLIKLAHENAKRDVVMGKDGLTIEPVLRQVIYAWVDPTKNEASLNVSKLAERITGLKVANRTIGPSLRLTGYAPGSYRDLHVDTLPEMHVATFMLYFSDVGNGGETPFTTTGVNVVPRKGSVVFWYNLFTDGQLDESTNHGGCPVVFGEKWVALRWILYEWQDHHKCDLKPRTPYRILVNGK